MNKKLYRTDYNKMIGGVCNGIAEYLDIDPTIIRLLFVCLAFAGGCGVIAYIIAMLIMPLKTVR